MDKPGERTPRFTGTTYQMTGRHAHDYRYFSLKWDRCCICNGWRPHMAGRYVKKFTRGEK